jgi:hypothetical protein
VEHSKRNNLSSPSNKNRNKPKIPKRVGTTNQKPQSHEKVKLQKDEIHQGRCKEKSIKTITITVKHEQARTISNEQLKDHWCSQIEESGCLIFKAPAENTSCSTSTPMR